MRTALWLVVGLLAVAPSVSKAEEPAAPTLAERGRILEVELRRGPADALAPWLAPEAPRALRLQAIRALGRIGNRGGAPEWLQKLLSGAEPELEAVLRAAGLNAARMLEGAVARHAADARPEVAAAAVEALGWIGGESAAAKAAALLHAKEPRVRAAALDALARCRQEAYLERALRFVNDADEQVRSAASFAAWMLARVRKDAALAQDKEWPGDADLAARLVPLLGSAEPQQRLDGLRPFGLLAQKAFVPGTPLGEVVARLEADADPRVVQEFVARVLAPRPGPDTQARLTRLLAHADAKVREAAVEALGASPSPSVLEALTARGTAESDDAVRVALAVALVKVRDLNGEAGDLGVLLLPRERPARPGEVELSHLRLAAASKRPEAERLLVMLARQHRGNAPLVLEALDALGNREGTEGKTLVADFLDHPDAFVRAATVGLVGKRHWVEFLPRLEALLTAPSVGLGARDVPQAVVEAWAEFAKAAAPGDDVGARLRTLLLEASRQGATFTARAAAIKACNDLGIPGAPSADAHQPNDWEGLPLRGVVVPGLGKLAERSGNLDAQHLLRIADLMATDAPEFVVETTQGAFRLAVDPSEAPAHAVSFFLNVLAGTYVDTPWHRVVPSFVIQGGDPHGTGNGDAGYGLPDEITRRPFVRGALGMPKGEIRDTGGCQLFVMHSDYRPLDGRYTCYGQVLAGMETVDKIRVGDRILAIRVVFPDRLNGVRPR